MESAGWHGVLRFVALTLLLASAPIALADCGETMTVSERERLASEAAAAGDHDAAIDVLNCALEEIGDHRLKAAAVRNLIGRAYERAERYQRALSQFEHGLTILGDGDSACAEEVRNLLSGVVGTEKTYAGDEVSEVSQDLYDADIDAPDALGTRACQLDEQRVRFALALNTGNMYARQSQFRQAGIYYALADSDASGLGEEILNVHVTSNRAWVATADGRLDEAQALLDGIPGLEKTGSRAPLVRRALLAVAVNMRETDRLTEAIGKLELLTGLFAQAGDARGEGRVYAHLGTARLMNGDAGAAAQAYRNALAINVRVNDTEITRHANGGLARTYQKLGRLKDAQRHYNLYFEALDRTLSAWNTDQGRARILADQQQLLSDFVGIATELAVESGDFRIVRDAAEKARSPVLSELLRARRCTSGLEPGTLALGPALFGKDWARIRDEYAHAVPMEQRAPGVTVSNISLGVTLECDPGAVDPDPLEPVDAAIDDVPTLLEYFVTDAGVVITVKSGAATVNGALARIAPTELRDSLNDYLITLGSANARGMSVVGSVTATGVIAADSEVVLARRLHGLLIEPVAKWLPRDTDATLLVVPHGDLWRLPFAALLNDDGERLVDRHALVYSSSESAWREIKGRARKHDHRDVKAWVVGNPRMPQRLSACATELTLQPLPGAQAEAEAIAGMLDAPSRDLFIGTEADKLRLEAWHGDYSVLHFATHGFACPGDPLSSFIALAGIEAGGLEVDTEAREIRRTDDARLAFHYADPDDTMRGAGWDRFVATPYSGILEARDVIGRFALNADLVTLSACQTGVGRLSGEGMIGFTRAFLAAGARSLQVSLWRVDDESTTVLMKTFYREYLEHGNKAKALKKAMQKTRDRYTHPRHWAAFSLVGLAE